MGQTGLILATVMWVAGPNAEPSILTLERGAPECPGLAIRFINTPVHDHEDEFIPRVLDSGDGTTITIRVRWGGSKGNEEEGIYLEPGSPYYLVDPETYEPLEMLDVDEHQEGVACLVLPMG